jgi:hypothetical protein
MKARPRHRAPAAATPARRARAAGPARAFAQPPAQQQQQQQQQPVGVGADTLGDILRGSVPPPPAPAGGAPWRLPWPLPFPQAPDDPARAKARLRAGRSARLRAALAESRGAPAIEIPPLPPAEGEAPAPAADYSAAASNAGPFAPPPARAAAAPPAPECAAAGAAAGAPPAPPPRAHRARRVLPWLLAVDGALDLPAVEAVASRLALARLATVDVLRAGGGARGGPLRDSVRWAGAAPLPSPPLAAAAAIHRAARRRGGALAREPRLDGAATALCYGPAAAPAAAAALAAYLHLFGGADAREAARAAGAALRAPPPPPEALDALVEEAAAAAAGWLGRAELRWRYGGGAVAVVGDVVGSWDERAEAPLAFDVGRREWRLQLWGLPPGAHAYKFRVDGRWCVDIGAPCVTDEWGNANNVAVVPPPWAAAAAGAADAAAAAAAEEGDGMAGGAAAAAEEDEGVLLVGPDGEVAAAAAPAPAPPDPAQRLRLARLGAAVLALYSRTSLTRKAAPARR